MHFSIKGVFDCVSESLPVLRWPFPTGGKKGAPGAGVPGARLGPCVYPGLGHLSGRGIFGPVRLCPTRLSPVELALAWGLL